MHNNINNNNSSNSSNNNSSNSSNNNNNNKIVAATCRHLPGERTLTSSYRWPFLLKQIVMERRKIMTARTTKTILLSFFVFPGKDNDLQQIAMERRRRREVMTARMMAMTTVLKPPLLRLISSVRTPQRGLTYTWW